MATLEEIARLANVSTGTVSRVLNGKSKGAWPSSLERAEQIRKLARTLNYRPNASARAMASQRTHQVGVLLRNAPDELNRFRYFDAYEMILGINERLEREGYVLSLARIGDVERGTEGSRVFRERMLEGMIVIDVLPRPVLERVQAIVPTCVWLDANHAGVPHHICRDEQYAGELVGQKLAEAGYRRLVWVDFSLKAEPHYSHAHRREGLARAAEAAGLDLEQIAVSRDGFGEQGDRLRSLLSPETAVVAYNTNIAARIAHAAPRWRKLVGVDFGLACCDDNHITETNWPDLAHVHTDRLELGKAAADMLLQLLDETGKSPESQTIRGVWKPGFTAAGPGKASEV